MEPTREDEADGEPAPGAQPPGRVDVARLARARGGPRPSDGGERAPVSHPPSFVEVGLTIAGALLAVLVLLYVLQPPA